MTSSGTAKQRLKSTLDQFSREEEEKKRIMNITSPNIDDDEEGDLELTPDQVKYFKR